MTEAQLNEARAYARSRGLPDDLAEDIINGEWSPVRDLMQWERDARREYHEVRSICRKVLGVFRWRYYRDRMQGWLIRFFGGMSAMGKRMQSQAEARKDE